MDISHSSIATIFSRLTELLPNKWKRRRGSLGPVQVFYTIMCMTTEARGGYRKVLDYLKREVGDRLGWDSEPCPSSFSEARRKLSKKQCKMVFRETSAHCAGLAATPKVCYKNYRILAVDMTRLALPVYADVIKGFGCPKDNKGKTAPAPQATLTALWDVSTNTPVDWLLERVYASERFAAYELAQHVGPQDPLIGDRGYPARTLLKQLSDQGAKYLLRMPGGTRGGFLEVREFRNDASSWDKEVWPGFAKRINAQAHAPYACV